MENVVRDQWSNPRRVPGQRAETAAAAHSPGKFFLPWGTQQVSINHHGLASFRRRRVFFGAKRRSRRWFCVLFLPAACAFHASGAVMATKTETQSMDDGEAAESEQPTAKRRFSLKLPSLKMMLMGLAGLVAVIAIGGGGYFFFFAGHGKAEAAAPAAVGLGKPVVFLDMPDVLVNLSSGGGSDRTQYLKVKVTLELPDQAMSAQIQPVMPRLMDTFQTYLRELRPSDLDGSAGLYRLKEELTRRVNAAIAPGRINAVLFKEIVVQ
jgi:flagellar protein FliL